MKKHLMLVGVITTVLTTTGAHAVTKCVALNSSTTCTSDSLQYRGHTDWAAACTTNGVSTPISGIGICGSTDGGSIGATATELDISSTNGNKHCWCKMTSPAVSRWVFYASLVSAGDCAWNCAYLCAYNVQSPEAFRSALFGSLSD